ncbi:MAG TPA: succinate dehydrogenase cytochrome b subunit [Egibacteraceae bacterium]|nr:succinate dehydrogenase cytochrome b subunit [Egibacteraceae bacterium]
MAIDRPVTAPQREDAERRDTAVGRSRRVAFAVDFYRSAVGKKYVMAITGIILMAYVFAHMVGNLKIYLGAEEMNHYGEFLRQLAYPIFPHSGALWIMRLGLLAAVILHIHAAVALTRMNRRSRPTKYASKRDYIAADFAARTMRWTGWIVFFFILFHLADLTIGTANPDFQHGMPYENTVASFQRPLVAIFYIVANIALGVHLYHGAWSMFQSLGWNRRRFNAWRRYFATAFAAIIVVGNVSFPIAVMTGIVS